MTAMPPPSFPPAPLPGRQPLSKSAVTSLVLSLLLCIPLVTSLLGLIFGIVGIRATRNAARAGRGLAIAGLIVSLVGILGWALVGGTVLFLFRATEAPRALTHSFAANVVAGNIAAASAECDPAITADDLAKLKTDLATFGTFKGLTCYGVNLRTSPAGSVCEMAGLAEFSSGPRKFEARALKDASGAWKIVAFEVK